MNDNLIVAGRILGSRGLTGELRVKPLCDSVDELCERDTLYVNDTEYGVKSARTHKGMALITLEGVDTREAADRLAGRYISVPRQTLDEGVYYIADLIGMTVLNGDVRCGTLVDVLNAGYADAYVIRGEDGREFAVPALREVVRRVDVASKTMHIKWEES